MEAKIEQLEQETNHYKKKLEVTQKELSWHMSESRVVIDQTDKMREIN